MYFLSGSGNISRMKSITQEEISTRYHIQDDRTLHRSAFDTTIVWWYFACNQKRSLWMNAAVHLQIQPNNGDSYYRDNTTWQWCFCVMEGGGENSDGLFPVILGTASSAKIYNTQNLQYLKHWLRGYWYTNYNIVKRSLHQLWYVSCYLKGSVLVGIKLQSHIIN